MTKFHEITANSWFQSTVKWASSFIKKLWEGLILAINWFFLKLWVEYIFICYVQSKSGIFPILWKKCNIVFEFSLLWGPYFLFHRILPHTHKKLVSFSVLWHKDHQNIPNLTMLKFGSICPRNYEMGFRFLISLVIGPESITLELKTLTN